MSQPARPVCLRCGRPLTACICPHIVPTDNVVSVLILQHPLEVRQAKGSANLLALSLRAARLEVGESFDPDALQHWLTPPTGGQTLLLYPATTSPRAPALLDAAACRGPLQLVILDGTWRKSLRMLHLNPALQALPRLALHPEGPSRYLIRKARRPDQLSTLEACCVALGELEQAPQRYAPLLGAFETFVSAQAARRPPAPPSG